MNRKLVYALSISILVGFAATAAQAATLWPHGPVHPEAYDYAPSVLFDHQAVPQRWKAYWCGLSTAGTGDAIWYAESTDNMNWTTPQELFSGPSLGITHVCDPTVLYNPQGLQGIGWPWVMYFNDHGTNQAGCPGGTNCNNKVRIAVSANGLNWIAQPVHVTDNFIGCAGDMPSTYGCGQFSVIFIPGDPAGQYVATFGKATGNSSIDGTWYATSTDGVHFTEGPQRWVTGTSGVDLMYNPQGVYKYLFTRNIQVTIGNQNFVFQDLQGATSLGSSWTQLGYWIDPDQLRGSATPGFYRDNFGWRRSGDPVWTMIGFPADNTNGTPDGNTELQALWWGEGLY